MKASELIKELQEMQEKYGDLTCRVFVDSWRGGEDEEVAAVVLKNHNGSNSYFHIDY